MKITIKDIALESGVSVATVSYILNDNKSQKISLETKKRVLEVVKKYNYSINSNAKSFSKNKKINILFCYDVLNSFSLIKSDIFLFYEKINSFLGNEYSFSINQVNNNLNFSLFDVIIFYRIDSNFLDSFIKNNPYKKIIIIDSLFNNLSDNTYLISSKFTPFYKDKETIFICLPLEKKLENELKSKLHLEVFTNFKEVDYFINRNYYKNKIISFSKSLYEYFLAKEIKLTYSPLDSEKKIVVLINLLNSFSLNKEITQHKYTV